MSLDLAFPAVTFILGLLLGSFYNVCIERYVAGGSVVRPRSHCPACARTLTPWELVPVLSWLWLRGRCAGCGTRISLQYPLLEIISGIAALLLALRLGPGPAWLGLMALSGLLMVASGIDFKILILPDKLILPGVVLAFIVSTRALGLTVNEAAWGAVAGAGSFKLIQFGYRWLRGREGLGSGDVKLMLLVGALVGWKLLPLAVLLASLTALPAGLWAMRKARLTGEPPLVPFGPFLSLGAMLAALYGEEFFLLVPLLVGV